MLREASVTWTKNNLNLGRQAITPDGSVYRIKETAENTHKVETKLKDFLSRFEGINLKGEGTVKVPTKESPPDFVGKLKGEEVILYNVKTEKVTFNKRNPNDTARLRKDFNKIRKDLMKSMADNPDKIKELKKAGISDNDIEDMMEYGLVPDGWQVHHKIPLDQGGSNDVENLVLIKNYPYHKVITIEQNSLTKGMKPGDSKIVDFPIPEGDIYPPKKD